MHRIGRGRDEIEFLIEVTGFVILGMNREGTDAGNVRGLQGALHGVPQKRFPDALALPATIYRQTRKEHNGYRMRNRYRFSSSRPQSKDSIG